MSKSWSTGICEQCCSYECFCACFFPCCVFAENVNLMGKKGFAYIPVVDLCNTYTTKVCSKGACAGVLYSLGIFSGALTNAGPDMLYANNCLGCFSVFLHSRVRRAIRKEKGIPPDCCGDGCSDICCALFCYSCAMAQEQATLELMAKPQQNSMFTDVPIKN
jgi:Cys-rich protein (TIGR01571 family)